MNILHTECSMNWGGQEYRTLLEHNYLNLNNHTSWIMCHPKSAFFKKAQSLQTKNIIPMDLSKPWKFNISFKLLKFCIKNKVDVINTHGSKDSLLGIIPFLYGVPLIRSRQITSPVKRKNSYQYGCTHIIAAAHAIKDILVNIGVNKNHITVIGEGVDTSEYKPDNDSNYLRKEFNIKDNDTVVINIGMIRPDKGQEYYLEAANIILSHNKNIKFFLVGEGVEDKNQENKLKEKIKEYDISNTFIMTGYRDDITNFTHLADIVVIASTAVEAQSRIVPQAFATKRTVVSTNTGGLTELVKNKVNGLVVPPKDATSMCEAIEHLIHNEDIREQFSDAAYRMAIKELSFENMMNRTLKLYLSIINK